MYVNTKLENIYNASKKSKDKFLIKETLLSKLGELLAKDKADLIKSLKDRQLTFTKTSDKFILSLLLDQMKRSEQYCREVVELMLTKEGVDKMKSGKMSAEMKSVMKEIADDENSKVIILEYREQVVYCDDDVKKLYADATNEDVTKKLAKRNKWCVIGGIAIGGLLFYATMKILMKMDKKTNMSIEEGEEEGSEKDNDETEKSDSGSEVEIDDVKQ